MTLTEFFKAANKIVRSYGYYNYQLAISAKCHNNLDGNQKEVLECGYSIHFYRYTPCNEKIIQVDCSQLPEKALIEFEEKFKQMEQKDMELK